MTGDAPPQPTDGDETPKLVSRFSVIKVLPKKANYVDKRNSKAILDRKQVSIMSLPCPVRI